MPIMKKKPMPKQRNPVVMIARTRNGGYMHDHRGKESIEDDDNDDCGVDIDTYFEMDNLIPRAERLLAFMDQEGVAETLMNSGVSSEDAFLAVKAAACGANKS